MIISRKGATADHGVKSVTLVKGKISFDPADGEFLAKFDKPASDFSLTGSRHIYRTKVDLAEYLSMTEQVANSIKQIDDEKMLALLKASVFHFLRIATVLSSKG